ncbi:MAG: glycosyltransferase family 4 protein [Planctomycetes bacterium]|nr:glycosyltransferase family 4 protein [Planctomycetota bacterium]
MRVGYLSAKNYTSRTSFSGIVHAMRVALGKRERLTVIDLGPEARRLRERFKRRVGLGMRDPDLRHPRQLDRFSRELNRQLAQRHLDVLFAPVASVELGVVESSLPAVYASDATFHLLNGFYDLGFDAARVALEEAHERAAIARATRLLYPSRWAAQSAVRDYGAREDRIDLAQFGANVLEVPDAATLARDPARGPLRLLFVRRDYRRKGGAIAVEATAALRARGHDARLTVVGCVPPRAAEGVTVIPYLNKDDPAQARTLRELYRDAHFFVFPTRADCSPISLCEAAAFGLPAVCTDLAGIPDIVAEGAGVLMPLEADGAAYAERIHALLADPRRYAALTDATRRAYDERLNWDAWAARAEASLRQAVADARA